MPIARYTALFLTSPSDAQLRRHGPRTPLRGSLGQGLRGQSHQPGHIHLDRGCPARQIPLNAGQTQPTIALAPARHLYAAHSQLLGDLQVLQPVGSQQHHAGALRKAHAGELRAHQPHQLGSLLVAQNNLGGYSHARSPPWLLIPHWSRTHHNKFH